MQDFNLDAQNFWNIKLITCMHPIGSLLRTTMILKPQSAPGEGGGYISKIVWETPDLSSTHDEPHPYGTVNPNKPFHKLLLVMVLSQQLKVTKAQANATPSGQFFPQANQVFSCLGDSAIVLSSV